jgi:DNA polymerase-3 subunit epsilon
LSSRFPAFPMPASNLVLPSRYYLDHFEELLGFVSARYGHALDEAHRSFLGEFQALPEAARCLYVRLANRKGRVFPRRSMRYPEIGDLEEAAETLRLSGFARGPQAGDFAELLALEPREALFARLAELASREGAPPPKRSARKAELVADALARLPFDLAFPEPACGGYLVQERVEEIDYLVFLYFGGVRRDLTAFTLRDLGRARTAPFRSEFEARFASGESARAAFFYARILERLDRAAPDEAAGLFAEVAAWPEAEDPEVAPQRHRALHRLGRLLERVGLDEEALAVHLRSGEHPSNERAARLLLAAGRRDEAAALLGRMVEDPSSDAELLFAEDFLERKFGSRRVGRLTELLRCAPELALDESGRDRPEATAAARLRREGAEAAHVENAIWSQLFGLLFWDLLFGPEHAALHDPFDFMPRDLASGTFLERHGAEVGRRLARLDDPAAALLDLESVWREHHGLPNPLVPWDEALFRLARRLVAAAPSGALATVLGEMARDHRANRSGFPDLVVFEGGGVRFLEIKAEGDQLRRQQLVQIERLRRAGLEVGVARVRWTVDPQQDYVVVDIETTGSDASAHRVTEIGAVRVRGGEAVAEWSSLVNPGRRIPGFISRLTGITDEMVAGAPDFAAIADEFRAFLGDAVFVAHRAAFDHGFLKAEFARLGQSLGGPVLCTVVETRRHFPGLSSYGLAALCGHFGIPLESHHRALCDARATAELLLRIQEQRLAKASSEPTA